MNCPTQNREGTEILLAYTAGKLDAARSAAVAGHLQACTSCREFTGGQAAVWKALDAWEAAPVSPDFDRRLYARIDREVSLWDLIVRPFRPLFMRQGLPMAAAVAVLLMAGFLLDRPPAINPVPAPQTSADVESVAPDQAEQTLREMEMMRELNRLVHPDGADSKI